MNNTLLSMKGIRKTFSGVAVLDEVELKLNEGECLGLFRNGGGANQARFPRRPHEHRVAGERTTHGHFPVGRGLFQCGKHHCTSTKTKPQTFDCRFHSDLANQFD